MNDNISVLLIITTGGVFLLVVSFIVIFIRHQNKLLKQKDLAQQAELLYQEDLLKAIIVSQETERKRIGQDLHDDVGTALSNLRITIEMFDEMSPSGYHDFSMNCRQLIDRVVTDVRQISHNLSPPGIELYGFWGALEDLTDMINKTGKIQVIVTNNAASLIDTLDLNTSIALYRVMEELLNNTMKHARAGKVIIGFKTSEGFLLIDYHDDGRGIGPALQHSKGMGMHNIESRLKMIGASFTISPPAENGFNIYIRIKHEPNQNSYS